MHSSPPSSFLPSHLPSFLCPVFLPDSDDSDEAQLYQSWFKLVLEKNRLARYESELMILSVTASLNAKKLQGWIVLIFLQFLFLSSRGQTIFSSSVSVPRSLNWRTHRVGCSKIYDAEWQWRVRPLTHNDTVRPSGRTFIIITFFFWFYVTLDTKKSASELQEEQAILSEIMRTVEKRDMLVSVLEEQRLKERAEDKDLESLVLSKGYEFHWAHADDSWGQVKLD